MRILFRWVLVPVVVLLSTMWAGFALWIDGPSARPLAGALVAGFAILTLALFIWVRPFWRAVMGYALAFALVLGWWLSLEARNDRDWLPDVARSPRAEIDGDRLMIHNVRNFDYRSEEDYTQRWETRSYDLSQLRGVDLFLSYWGSPWIAHTIASWDFGEGRNLAISIETRKEKGEQYSALRGFFRQFELHYVVADERDVIRLRTNYRGETVRLYHLKTPPELARAILLSYLEEFNRLVDKPRWYNALIHNCTTMIRHHVRQVAPANPFDWRILVNGRIDELGYERGNVDTSLPFEELRRRSEIVEAAKSADADPAFSARIREGLPGKRP
jgi:hypothetical protein